MSTETNTPIDTKPINTTPKRCNCAELRKEHTVIGNDGKPKIVVTQLPIPNYPGFGKHDCKEVRRRNTFLVPAEFNAIELTRKTMKDEDPGFGHRFTQHLSREMDRLCRQPFAA